ncbi:flagellar hook assembly protein FlgD [Haloimpatiens sp. FM7315]|uniref:flagellar hook assembly protein FlgD n=1 Tax=Haloimpatiens sp. FM7315 TaxID=3298609 RepID=UPI0035A32673
MSNTVSQTERGTEIYNGISGAYETSRATDRGTRIVKKGSDLDKNAFLKILTAELSNQDPTNAKDSTQFVSQLAQFSSLEQMTNLNTNMSFSSSQSLVGKLVALNSYDDRGVQYGGIVQSVEKNGDDIKVNVQVSDKGKSVIKEFKLSDVKDVINVQDNRLDYINGNMGFILASNMMNKKIEAILYSKDDSGKSIENKYSGIVKGITREQDGIKLRVPVEVNGKIEDKFIPYDAVVKVELPEDTKVNSNEIKEDSALTGNSII